MPPRKKINLWIGGAVWIILTLLVLITEKGPIFLFPLFFGGVPGWILYLSKGNTLWSLLSFIGGSIIGLIIAGLSKSE